MMNRESTKLDLELHAPNEQRKYSFYKNNSFISEVLDINPKSVRPIENDWQDQSILPHLKNHLDILPKCPGIYPTEAITQFNSAKLTPFFTRLPQYSQINEACISPYFPPGQDVNLKRLATKYKAKYMMSTSTITSLLNHVYFSLSNYKSPHFNDLSKAFDNEPLKFMLSQRKPNTIFLRKMKNNTGHELYAVDGDAGFTEASN